MAAFIFAEPTTYGIGKALAGVVFGTGLMLVVLAGECSFSPGNVLIRAAVCEEKYPSVKSEELDHRYSDILSAP
jgi:formate/nitrite transporter FocA (FNT family)